MSFLGSAAVTEVVGGNSAVLVSVLKGECLKGQTSLMAKGWLLVVTDMWLTV
jgi:hypothetical protein